MKDAGAVAISHAKKLVKLTVSVFKPGFEAAKCKTAAKMAIARIKLLRNKREVVVRQMRRDIALLLQSGQDSTARIRVEHVFREQNVLAANELIELFCELLVSRLSIISKQSGCPSDLKEGVSSLLFAGPRCSEIPELASINKIFVKKYGADFVSSAVELRPNCGVNPTLIDKLSVRTPSGEMKLKMMKEIAKEYQVEWDATESEKELLKPPEELIDGPRSFVSASSLPVTRSAPPANSAETVLIPSKSISGAAYSTPYVDTASAAEAAAESARQAITAAQAAALMANKDLQQAFQAPLCGDSCKGSMMPMDDAHQQQQEFRKWVSSDCHLSLKEDEEAIYKRRHSCNTTMQCFGMPAPAQMVKRSQSYSPASEDIKFDESPPPPVPTCSNGTHPKLPDYDELNARFHILKQGKP